LSTSNISKPPDPFTFFLDRTHGRKTFPNLLRRVGFSLVALHEHGFAPETQDDVWIEECGKQIWVILSGDKGLERNPINKAAIIAAACKVFIFTDNNSKAEEWAAAVIMGRAQIARIIDKNNGPFYVHIGRECQSHVSAVKFVGTGGRKIVEESAAPVAVPVVAEPTPNVEAPAEPEVPKQDDLFPKE
jgi:PIN like domain